MEKTKKGGVGGGGTEMVFILVLFSLVWKNGMNTNQARCMCNPHPQWAFFVLI